MELNLKHIAITSAFAEDLKKGLSMLFETYGQALYGFSIHKWGLTEDEGYETLYKTIETVGKVIARYEFESESHFSNWLFKIHKNNIFQLLRSKNRATAEKPVIINFEDWENELESGNSGEEGDHGNGDIHLLNYRDLIEELSVINPYETTADQGNLMLAMQKALQQLNETDRELLLLKVNGYNYNEIAVMLGIENNQLKVKFSRAKGKLEKLTLSILNETYNEKRN